MQDLGNTQFFKVDVDTASSVEVILETVFEVMKEKDTIRSIRSLVISCPVIRLILPVIKMHAA